MRVLVTGGAGFIGSHVVTTLRTRGHEPVVHDVRTDPASDVRDPAAVRRALKGVDAVCHQAATVGLGTGRGDAAHYVSRNDLGTAVLLTAMAEAGVRRLGPAGSTVVCGEGRRTRPRHGVVRPGPRAVGDLDAGRLEPSCPVCGTQLSPGLVGEEAPADPRNVYGPGMPRDTPYAGVASFFRSSPARGEAPRVFEDGCRRRDSVHGRDVAAANVSAPEAGSREGALTAYGSGEPRAVGEMARAPAGAYGGPEPVVTGEYRLGDVRHITADPARLRAHLARKPEVGFEEGMREFARAGLRGA